jgi:hypothetical protein
VGFNIGNNIAGFIQPNKKVKNNVKKYCTGFINVHNKNCKQYRLPPNP